MSTAPDLLLSRAIPHTTLLNVGITGYKYCTYCSRALARKPLPLTWPLDHELCLESGIYAQGIQPEAASIDCLPILCRCL